MVFHKTHGMNQPLFSMRTLYVSRTPADSSVYPTISAALDAIPMDLNEPACIYLAPGIYHEKITINKPYLTILGTGKSNKDVVLTYDDYALAPMADIGKLGTFRSYSVFIDTHDVTLQNLTIENASGDSLTHGQAIALYADGDRLVIDSCRLIGHQDTLFTGPLPPKEIEPDGFIGPKQFAPRINGRQYYKNCYICGDIDFIFGSATAYFENCVIESLCRTTNVNDIQGYITAASTPESQEYGYVFSNCKLISKTVLQILSISEGHGAIMLKPCFLNVHWEIIFMNAVFMTGRKRMHEIRFCTQNIEITPHPAQTQHPITVP